VLQHLQDLTRRALDDWSHALTATIGLSGFGVMLTAVEIAGKLAGLVAVVVAITCSVRREIRESRAANTP
jgi:hypothetical protein